MPDSDTSKKTPFRKRRKYRASRRRGSSHVLESKAGKETPSALAGLVTMLERLTKIFAAGAALVYICGIVVVAGHLGRYGYYSLGLLEIDYAAAGFWSLLPPLLFALSSFAVYLYYLAGQHHESEDERIKRIASDDKFLISVAIILGIVVVFLIFWWLEIEFTPYWVAAGIGGLLIAVNLYAFSWLTDWSKNREDESKDKANSFFRRREKLLAAALLVLFIIALPLYLVFFARYVFQAIPDTLGGGKLPVVVLVAKDEAARALIESAGIQFADAQKTVPVRLLRETDKGIFIIPDPQRQTRSIKLDNDLVTAVLYHK